MEEDIKSRLPAIRVALGLTKSKFAEKLGLTHSAISLIESGKNTLTEQNINLICLTFQVNRSWLRTGKGSMFNKEVPGERELLDIFRKLSPPMRQSVLKITQELLEAQKKANAVANNTGDMNIN